MSLSHLLVIYRTEFQKLLRHSASIIGLFLCTLFGVLGPLFTWVINWGILGPLSEQAQQNPGAPMTMQAELLVADQAITTAFVLRGFFFLPIVLFIMGAMTFASEYASRSIREYSLRPIPRPALILTRWFALCTWVHLGVFVTFVLSALGGMVLTGSIVDGTEVLKNVGTTLVTDLAFVTLALSIAILTRSMAATIAILVMTFVLQIGAKFVLSLLTTEALQGVVLQMLPEQLSFVENTFWLADYLVMVQPPLLLGSWSTHWAGYCTLALVTFGWFFISIIRFQRMDIP